MSRSLLILFFKRMFIFLIVVVNTDLVIASEDWVYDLRYNEFLTQANKGNGTAMYELGVMTERGHGIEINIVKAIQWYQKALDHNNSNAYVRLGKLYLEGKAVDKDYNKAFSYLQSAKKNKVSGTYYYLAIMYENGYGTTRNLALAKENYDKAAKWGHYGAKEKSEKIAKHLSRKSEIQVSTRVVHKNKTKIDTRKEIKKTKSVKQFVTVKDIKKSLLTGMWFDGDIPLGFLPSPQTYCISKKNVGLRCVSKEMQKNTGREKIYYLIESRISDIDNYGDFTITYKNKVTKVDVYNKVNELGEIYVSRIKVGPQKKEHILKCNVIGNNVNCNKDGRQNYSFVNLTKEKKVTNEFISGFE